MERNAPALLAYRIMHAHHVRVCVYEETASRRIVPVARHVERYSCCNCFVADQTKALACRLYPH